MKVTDIFIFFFKQKTAYEMRISDWSSDVCSSDLLRIVGIDEPRETDDVGGLVVQRDIEVLRRQQRADDLVDAPIQIVHVAGGMRGLRDMQQGCLQLLCALALTDVLYRRLGTDQAAVFNHGRNMHLGPEQRAVLAQRLVFERARNRFASNTLLMAIGTGLAPWRRAERREVQNGRASGRERECQYVEIWLADAACKKNSNRKKR